MSSNPWISGAVPFGKYLADARAESRTYAETVVIDRLGSETPEMRAERKAAERKPSLGIAHVLSIVATMLVVAALFTVVGAFYGASDPDAVKDLMPSVPSLSGERAEPEGGAR